MPIIASGGIRNGLEIAKCISLGAIIGGMAGPFLKAATQSVQAVLDEIDITAKELRVTMFGIGVDSITALQKSERLVRIKN